MEGCCRILHVSRSAYYKWLRGDVGERIIENRKIAEKMEEIHTKDPSKGYRRIKDDLYRDYGIRINDKRALRICRSKEPLSADTI